MVRIDDLIQNIQAHEAPELPGYMDEQMEKRVAAKVMAAIGSVKDSENKNQPYKKISVRRRFFVFGMAAILLLGLCLTAFADSNPDWDVEILTFMGLDKTSTLQLDSGEVKIQVYDECEAIEYDPAGNPNPLDVKVLAARSIGDKNSACIRIETDYKLPESFHPETDYILPEGYSVKVYEKDPAKYPASIITMGSTFSYVESNDGTLTFMLYITGCQGLNKAYVDIQFEDFYWYHDLNQTGEQSSQTGLQEEQPAEEELLLEGSWHLTWKYAYKSNVKEFKQLKSIQIDEINYYLTNLEISPVSVQINGFRMPWNRKETFDGFIIDKINYTDGTSLIIDNVSSAGNRNGIWLDSFLGTMEMGEVIRTDQLESIIISGNQIELR